MEEQTVSWGAVGILWMERRHLICFTERWNWLPSLGWQLVAGSVAFKAECHGIKLSPVALWPSLLLLLNWAFAEPIDQLRLCGGSNPALLSLSSSLSQAVTRVSGQICRTQQWTARAPLTQRSRSITEAGDRWGELGMDNLLNLHDPGWSREGLQLCWETFNRRQKLP